MNQSAVFLTLLAGLTLSPLSAAQSILTMEETPDRFTVSSAELKLQIGKDPWHIAVYDKEDKLVTQEKEGGVFIFGEDTLSSYAGTYESLGYDIRKTSNRN